MGLLDTVLASDSEAFVDADLFGESAIAKPHTGSNRNIKVVAYRGVPLPGPNSVGAIVDLVVDVRNDAALGYAGSSIVLRGDKINIARRLGVTAEDFPILEIMAQDAGMLRLKLA